MAKFKVGDRVLYNGKECYYVLDDGDSSVQHLIETKDGWPRDSNVPEDYIPKLNNRYYFVNTEDLELISEEKPQPKFKVGDRVRVIYCRQEENKHREGQIERVTNVFRDGLGWRYNTNKDLMGYVSAFTEDQLQLVEEEATCCESGTIFYVNASGGLCISTEGTQINKTKQQKIMSKVTRFVKNLTLSADEKLLRKFDLHDECGNTTAEGREAILENFFNNAENQAYLVSIAKGLEAEEAKNK